MDPTQTKFPRIEPCIYGRIHSKLGSHNEFKTYERTCILIFKCQNPKIFKLGSLEMYLKRVNIFIKFANY